MAIVTEALGVLVALLYVLELWAKQHTRRRPDRRRTHLRRSTKRLTVWRPVPAALPGCLRRARKALTM